VCIAGSGQQVETIVSAPERDGDVRVAKQTELS
jgi:hypothetical protein